MTRLQKELQAIAEKKRWHVYGQREEIIEAFIAKYGFGPDEVEQVEERCKDGSTKWYVRKKE